MIVVIFAVKNSIKRKNHMYLGLAWAFQPVTLETWDRRKLSIYLVPLTLWLLEVLRGPCAGQCCPPLGGRLKSRETCPRHTVDTKVTPFSSRLMPSPCLSWATEWQEPAVHMGPRGRPCSWAELLHKAITDGLS